MKSKITKEGKSNIFLQNLYDTPECEYLVESGAELTVIVFANGVRSVDGITHVRLIGNDSQASILGAFVNNGTNRITLHTLQHHEAQGTTSNLLVKTVLDGDSSFSYDGAIRVEKEGQKTDAYQRNENLLLSNRAFAQSKPSLEILADDVRCTHGATIGSIDVEQLFYLQTRGIMEKEGRSLIVEGFLESLLVKITDAKKSKELRKELWETL